MKSKFFNLTSDTTWGNVELYEIALPPRTEHKHIILSLKFARANRLIPCEEGDRISLSAPYTSVQGTVLRYSTQEQVSYVQIIDYQFMINYIR